MSDFADAYIKRLKYLRSQPNKFEFDKDGNLLLLPNNEEDMKRVAEFFDKMRSIIREQIAQEIENAVIEVAGNSAATMEQAAQIARGKK
jgi:hypothetical protein